MKSVNSLLNKLALTPMTLTPNDYRTFLELISKDLIHIG